MMERLLSTGRSTLIIQVFVLGSVIFLAFTSAGHAETAPVTKCDHLAAHPDDFQRAEGVFGVFELGRIDVAAAIAACQGAVDRYPETPRFKYQLARAMIAGTLENERKDCTGALPLLEAAVREGHAEAAVQIGRCYSIGSGVAKDSEKGVDWTRRGYELGSPTAKARLAMAIAFGGYGYKKEVPLAVSILNELAEAGNTTALFRMFEWYREGLWVEKDLSRSFAYLLQAAERGDRMAQYLAWKFSTEGAANVGIDDKLADEYLARSAEAGYLNALRALAERPARLPQAPKTLLPHGKKVD